MVYKTLEIVKDQLSQFLEIQFSESDMAVLENISKVDDNTVTTMDNKVVLTLVTLQEEAALKNIPNVRLKNGKTEYRNTPVNAHIFVLVTANRDTYQKSLAALSSVAAYFQHKKVFTNENSPISPTITTLSGITSFKFTVELFSQTFEQHNHIWGALGGKSLPSILYKISIVSIEYDAVQGIGTPITEVLGTIHQIAP